MRVMPAVLTFFLTALAAAPIASAVYQPPPICPVCVPLAVIVITCAEAEANQDAFNSGDGCANVNQVQQCIGDEADQDLYDEGYGCGSINSQQSGLECQVRSVEALLGLAPHC